MSREFEARIDAIESRIAIETLSGQYRDVYQRRSGRWAFLQRTFEKHFATPLWAC